MGEIKELAKCVKCNGFSEVDTGVVLTTDPPQYQFECQHCQNKQFIWGSFIYRIPAKLLDNKRLHQLESIVENYLYANKESDVNAIQNEDELLGAYEEYRRTNR